MNGPNGESSNMSTKELHAFEAAIESIKTIAVDDVGRGVHALYLFDLHKSGCRTCQAVGKLCEIGQKISDFYDSTKGGQDAE